jgi:hypothetical protein
MKIWIFVILSLMLVACLNSVKAADEEEPMKPAVECALCQKRYSFNRPNQEPCFCPDNVVMHTKEITALRKTRTAYCCGDF